MLIERADGFVLSDDKSRLDLDRIRRWLADSYWAASRSTEAIEKSIANSATYGVYAPNGEHVALTRATTDYATFAWLGDVVVDAEWRGQGIGKWLVGEVVAHLKEVGVPRFVLATRDAHTVYETVGFEPMRYPSFWMELDLRADRPAPIVSPRG